MKRRFIKSQAFTLIELLVVIAVIALLLAVIMPALKKAKEQARMVVCASNNRQIALAVKVYADSNDDLIPSNKLGSMNDFNYDIARSEDGGYWTNMGRLYRDRIIESYDIFYCPSDKKRKPNVDYGVISSGPLKTIYPAPSEKPQWRIVGSYQYRIGRYSWRDEKIRTARLRGSTGIVGDAASFAKSESEKLFISHKDRCNYSYIDGHAEKIKLWPAYSDPDSIWWLHWIDQTSFRTDIYPFPSDDIPECPWPEDAH